MPNDPKKNFVKNLRIVMESRGKTQTDIAMALGVSSATVSDWCHGKKHPRIDKVQAIADYLDIGLNALLDDGDPLAALRLFPLTDAEYQFLVAYRAAENTARDFAFEMLIHHPRSTT